MTHKPFIWLIHCPRTGGTSVKTHCEKLSAQGLIAKYLNTSHRHYDDGMFKNLHDKYKRVVAVTVLRDPVRHMLSLYSYYLADKANPDHAMAIKMPFINWLGKYKQINYYIDFYGQGNVAKAEEILKKFDYRLRLESLKSDANKMLTELGLPANFNQHQHKGDIRHYKASADEIAKLKRVRADDYKLLSRLGLHYD